MTRRRPRHGAALVDFVRVHAARERLRLPDEAPATRALALALADECHTVCIGGGRRAYGCRCLLAGLDADGEACLWSVGPGGDARHHKSGVAAVGGGGRRRGAAGLYTDGRGGGRRGGRGGRARRRR